jgi:hypothetical protein
MDNFTITVLVGDVLVVAVLIALMVFDKHQMPAATSPEPSKPSKKTA